MPPLGHSSGHALVRWLLTGLTGIVFFFLYAPIVVLVAYSFNDSRLSVLWEGFTLRWYRALGAEEVLLEAAKNSLVIASITTVLSVVMGTLGAWLLHRYRFRGADAIRALITIPMIMPEVLLGISLLVLFAAARFELGFSTVVIGHVTFGFPFVLTAVRARLAGLDPSLEEAALDLGATPARAFFSVILPCLRPAILAGALMAFTLSFDELIVTFFTTSAASTTLPLRVFGMAKVGLNPMLNALCTLFVLGSLLLVALTSSLSGLRQAGIGGTAR